MRTLTDTNKQSAWSQILTTTVQNKYACKHIFPSAASWHRAGQDLGVNGNKCLFSERLLGLLSLVHVCCWIYLTLIPSFIVVLKSSKIKLLHQQNVPLYWCKKWTFTPKWSRNSGPTEVYLNTFRLQTEAETIGYKILWTNVGSFSKVLRHLGNTLVFLSQSQMRWLILPSCLYGKIYITKKLATAALA